MGKKNCYLHCFLRFSVRAKGATGVLSVVWGSQFKSILIFSSKLLLHCLQHRLLAFKIELGKKIVFLNVYVRVTVQLEFQFYERFSILWFIKFISVFTSLLVDSPPQPAHKPLAPNNMNVCTCHFILIFVCLLVDWFVICDFWFLGDLS